MWKHCLGEEQAVIVPAPLKKVTDILSAFSGFHSFFPTVHIVILLWQKPKQTIHSPKKLCYLRQKTQTLMLGHVFCHYFLTF